jgi:hypothetical protein
MTTFKPTLAVADAAAAAEGEAGQARLGEPLPPNGPAAAAFLASGVGATVLGLAIVLVEMSPNHVKKWLNLYDPVGPLSGKSALAVIAFALTWIIAGILLKGRTVKFSRWLAVSFALIGVGLLLTFPPIYMLFAAGH